MLKGVKMMSAKNLDSKGRFRGKIVSFRMSEEENKQLDRFVRLSGHTKQDYLIQRALQREISVTGNPRTYKALRNALAEVLCELRRIDRGDDVDSELIELISQINDTLDGLRK